MTSSMAQYWRLAKARRELLNLTMISPVHREPRLGKRMRSERGVRNHRPHLLSTILNSQVLRACTKASPNSTYATMNG